MTAARSRPVSASLSDVAFSASPISTLLLAADYRVVDANEAFLGHFQYARGRLRRCTILDLVVEGERDRLKHQLDELDARSADPIRSDVRLRHGDGTQSEVMAVFRRLRRAASDVVVIGQFVDGMEKFVDRERERLLAAIERAAFEWRTTFDAVETPIVIASSDGTVSRINRAARMLAGREYAEIIGVPIESLGTGEPWSSISELTTVVKKSRSPEARQVRDASGRTLDLLAMLFSADSDADDRVIVIAWDVTALIDLQARLEQQRTMATMGALVAGVAHEVRNPLFAISATIDAMEQAAPPELQEYFSVLREEIDRMTALMQDLLAYGRRSTTPFQAISIAAVVDSAVRGSSALAQRQKVTIKHHVTDARLTGDRERLTRAVQNLIDNAIQHSSAGEEVQVHCRTMKTGASKYAEIAVRDHGKGFNLNDLPRVFEPFFSKRKGGTGLGLSLVQQIVTEHGGEVTARNSERGGAEVVITLRLS